MSAQVFSVAFGLALVGLATLGSFAALSNEKKPSKPAAVKAPEVELLPPPVADETVDDRIIDPGDPQNMQKILLNEFADRLGRQPKTLEFLKAMKSRLADDEFGVLENRGSLADDPPLPKLQLLTSGDYAFRHGVKLSSFATSTYSCPI
jgi:hypothetical protein